MTSALVVIAMVVVATRAQQPQQPEHFKLGFLAPWNATFDDFSALTSASAISIAIERVHSDPTLNKSMRFRSTFQYFETFIISKFIVLIDEYTSGKRRQNHRFWFLLPTPTLTFL